MSGPPREGPPSSSTSLLARLTEGERTGYQVDGEIARGGMGAILKVRDEALRRDLAMKVILDAWVSADEATRAAFAHRFLEEAQVTAQLDHPGVVPVHELGVDKEGRLFFTMKLVRGRTLGEIFDLVRKGEEDWTVARAIQLVIRICETLAFAHSKGVVHRDLKPANVMVGAFGEVYVMDWGLAKVLGQHAEPNEQAASDRSLVLSERITERNTPHSPQLTQAGAIIGTPGYLPLEQAIGKSPDARSDVYAVGAMLYEMLAGHPPYGDPKRRRTGAEALVALMAGPPTPLAEIAPDLPAEIVAIAEKAMARDPADRYQSASELGKELRHFLEGRVVAAYRSGPIVELRKWVHRNRALATSIAAAVAIAITGLVVTVVLQNQASDRLRIAREKADASAAQARASQENALQNAEAAAAMAEEAKRSAERAEREKNEAERQTYFANITAANLYLANGNMAEARRKLTLCPTPYRAFEWHFQRALVDNSVALLEPGIDWSGRIAFSGDSRRFVVANGGPVLVYDTATRELVASIERMREHNSWIGQHLLLNSDGSRLYAQLERRVIWWGQPLPPRVAVIDVESGDMTSELELEPDPTRETAKGPKRSVSIVSLLGSRDRTVLAAVARTRVQDPARDDPTRVFGVPPVTDATVYVWNTVSGERISRLQLEDVALVALAPSGDRLAVAAPDGSLRLLDVEAGDPGQTIEDREHVPLQAMDFTIDGQHLVTASVTTAEQGALEVVIRRRDAETGLVRDTLRLAGKADDRWRCWSLVPGTSQLALGSGKDIQIVDFDPNAVITTLRGHDRAVGHIAVSPDGRTVVSSGSMSGRREAKRVVRVWEARGAEPCVPVRDHVWSWTQSPDGELLFLLRNQQIEVIDAQSGALLRTLAADAVGDIAVNHDATRIATGGRVTQILDATSGEVLHTMPPVLSDDVRDMQARPGGPLQVIGNKVAFSPDGRWLASNFALGEGDWKRPGSLQIWDTETGALVATLDDRAGCTPVHFSPDGRRLASEGAVWAVGTWERVAAIESGKPDVSALSPDGEILATDDDESIRLWDARTCEPRGVLGGHESGFAIVSIAFSPDGRRILSGDQSGALRIWDTDTLELVSVWHKAEIPSHARGHFWTGQLGFSPDGKRLYLNQRRMLTAWETDRERAKQAWRQWHDRAREGR